MQICVFAAGSVLFLSSFFFNFPSVMHERSSQAVETCLTYCLCAVLMRTAEKDGAFISCLPVLVKAMKRPQMGMDREAIE